MATDLLPGTTLAKEPKSPFSLLHGDRASLWRKGKDHPADDEIEEEDGIDYQGFAVWRLTVCQKSCGGCEEITENTCLKLTATLIIIIY